MDGSEVTALELAAVDLADPARVGVPVTAAKALLSKEMGSDPTPADQKQVSFPSSNSRRREKNESRR